jgi:hypothetical protein
MQRLSGGAVFAAIGGLAVVAAALVAQYRAVNTQDEQSAVWLAYVARPSETTGQLIVESRPGGAQFVLRDSSTLLAEGPTWSQDGHYFTWIEAVRSEDGESAPRMIIWNRLTHQETSLQLNDPGFGGFWWSPDSRLLVVVGTGLQAWTPSGELAFQQPATPLNQLSLQVLGWSPDGRLLAFLRNGGLFLFDGREIRSFSTSDFSLQGSFLDYGLVAWMGDGNLAVVNRTVAPGSIRAWALNLSSGNARPFNPTSDMINLLRLPSDEEKARIATEFAGSEVVASGRSEDGSAAWFGLGQPDLIRTDRVVVVAAGETFGFAVPNLAPPLRQKATFDVVVTGSPR